MPKKSQIRRGGRRRNRKGRTKIKFNRQKMNVFPTTIGRSELKYREYDLVSDFGSVSTTGTNLELSHLIENGNLFYQRIGATITICALQINFTIVGGQSDLGTDDEYNTVACRVYITPGATTPLIPAVCSVITQQSTKALKILFSNEFKLQSFSRNDTGYMPAVKHSSHKVNINTKFTWSQDSGDVYPMKRLYLQMVSDSDLVSNPGVTAGKIAVFFTDD
jgi:hypothetical protein